MQLDKELNTPSIQLEHISNIRAIMPRGSPSIPKRPAAGGIPAKLSIAPAPAPSTGTSGISVGVVDT